MSASDVLFPAGMGESAIYGQALSYSYAAFGQATIPLVDRLSVCGRAANIGHANHL
jgi:hypothetical protein